MRSNTLVSTSSKMKQSYLSLSPKMVIKLSNNKPRRQINSRPTKGKKKHQKSIKSKLKQRHLERVLLARIIKLYNNQLI